MQQVHRMVRLPCVEEAETFGSGPWTVVICHLTPQDLYCPGTTDNPLFRFGIPDYTPSIISPIDLAQQNITEICFRYGPSAITRRECFAFTHRPSRHARLHLINPLDINNYPIPRPTCPLQATNTATSSYLPSLTAKRPRRRTASRYRARAMRRDASSTLSCCEVGR